MPRLHHIDSLRAYAILMMLQGHFIYTMLAYPFHDKENFWYSLWMYGKGFTAPIFFTVTGLVLVYLLLRKNEWAYQKSRVNKALKRGFYLILWGYLLRASIWSLLSGRLNDELYKVDVLHCIGIGMLVIVGLYYVGKFTSKVFFQFGLLVGGILLFVIEPWTSALTFDHIPLLIRNYFTKDYGSLFIPAPWVGYTLIGGFIGTMYSNFIHKKIYDVPIVAIGLLIVGYLLSNFSSAFLMWIHHFFDILLFKQVAYNNYLYIRLGHVMIFISIFILLEKYLARLSWFNNIGQATLNVYIVHFFILYGSWFGLSLSLFGAHSLSPFWAITGAVLFMIVTTIVALKVPALKTQASSAADAVINRVPVLLKERWLEVKSAVQARVKKQNLESERK